MAALNFEGDDFHPEWNYSIRPSLGFVLICDQTRRGDFRIRRKSRRDRMRTKLRE